MLEETKSHIHHLYADVPFHEIWNKDISQLNDAELQALIKTTRANRVSPAERKKLRTSAAKKLSGKAPKDVTIHTALSGLI
jgi:uncharacterized protein with von Willebrand factor type A (vWA) domain